MRKDCDLLRALPTDIYTGHARYCFYTLMIFPWYAGKTDLIPARYSGAPLTSLNLEYHSQSEAVVTDRGTKLMWEGELDSAKVECIAFVTSQSVRPA